MALFGWGGACTISSAEFEPELVAGASYSPSGNGSAPGAAGRGAACGGAACADAGAECGGEGCGGSGAVASGGAGGGAADAGAGGDDASGGCALGRCEGPADCATGVCSGGCCAAPTCGDGVANGDEADVDCGGRCDARCGVGERCGSVDDCAPDLGCPASLGRCTPAACDNGVLDGAELLVDCGGGECEGCPDGTSCRSAVDCQSGSCGSDGRCSASCSDGVRNQDERGVDCGGVCGGVCPAGSACTGDAGCESGVCGPGSCALATDLTCCQPATCNDGTLNGDEADLDCGASDPLCPRCAPGRVCRADADCASGACEGGRCCGGTTGDCTRCAERLSPTVSCNDGPSGSADNCAAFLACLSANASVCTTRFAPGCTDDPGGVCNHNTYGGNGGLGVQRAAQVLAEAGCTP